MKPYYPEFSAGRFFISPVLGCPARCKFCYIYSQGLSRHATFNKVSIIETIQWIKKHPKFSEGPYGSVLSIGAMGDPFPPNINHDYIVDWIRELAKSSNPIQLISRFKIKEGIIKKLRQSIQYENQLLISTSISTFSLWKGIDGNAIPPEDRIKQLLKFKNSGFPTNLMIKPFLLNITERDLEIFTSDFVIDAINTFTVGVFYWNDEIIHNFGENNLTTPKFPKELFEYSFNHDLVCSPKARYKTHDGRSLDRFIELLGKTGVPIFKNASCVSAWLLNVPHVSKLHVSDPLNLCVKCGNC